MSEIIIVTETNIDVIVSGSVNQNINVSQVVQGVTVQTAGTQGPQGPAGATGPAGPAGPPGPAGGVTSVAGKTGAVDIFLEDIEQSGAVAGQVPQWDGTALEWVPQFQALTVLPNTALSAQIPDSTIANGNARGIGAVDFQRSRIAATQVASGLRSFIAGANNTASDTDAIALGSGNIVSEESSVGIGLNNNMEGGISLALGEANSITGSIAPVGRLRNFLVGSGNVIDALAINNVQLNTVIGSQNLMEGQCDTNTIIGTSNQVSTLSASSIGTVVIGDSTILDSSNSTTTIGSQNQLATSDSCFVAGGANNLTNCINTYVIGSVNTVSDTADLICIGGSNSTAFAAASAAYIVGTSNTVSTPNSTVIGESNTVTGTSALRSNAWGYQANTRGISGIFVFSNGRRANNGDSQTVMLVLRRTTTNATPAFVVSQGTSTPTAQTVLTLQNNSLYNCNIRISARSTGGSTAYWNRQVLIKRGSSAGTTTIVDNHVIRDFAEAGLASASISITADTTIGALVIQVTGIASTTIDWVADITATQLVRGA